MIPFYLVTGFLGSGKTTLLKRMLQKDKGRKWAVIQNEFAPTGVDGRELKEEALVDFHLEEINNGSVFCVCQMGNFISLLKHIILEKKPDAIVLEASGLSDPYSIIEILQHKDLTHGLSLAGVIAVADAKHFKQSISMLERVKHQLRIADRVIVNKVDLVDDEALQEIDEQIKMLNPFADISHSSYCMDEDDFFSTQTESITRIAGVVDDIDLDNRPGINTGVYRTHDMLNEDSLQAWMVDMSQRCIRFKAYLKLSNGTCVLAQSVFNTFHWRPCQLFDGRSEIVGIGEEIDIRVLRSLFIKYL